MMQVHGQKPNSPDSANKETRDYLQTFEKVIGTNKEIGRAQRLTILKSCYLLELNRKKIESSKNWSYGKRAANMIQGGQKLLRDI